MTGLFEGERVVRHAVTVEAPVEDVWWAWTTDAGIRSWLVDDSHIELRVGGPYEWYFYDEDAPSGRGSEDCVVLGFQAPTMLTFTWNAPPHLPEARAQRTVVLLRLRPSDEDGEGGEGMATRVELTELGWGEGAQWDEAFDYFDAAWASVLASLAKFFAGDDDAPRD